MAFKKEDLKKIADLLKIKAEDLEAVATATDEKAIEIPDVHTFSEDELKTVKANEYKSGKTAGVEIAVKEAREKMGLEFQGKTIDGLLDAHSKKVLSDAKIEQSEQVKQLNDKIATLQNTVKTQESAITEKENQVKQVFAKAEFAKAKWLPEDFVTQMALLGAGECEAGDPDAARKTLDEAMAYFRTNRDSIVDIFRGPPLRLVAKGYATLGDQAKAREIFALAINEGAINGNARPRAEDLAAACADLATTGVEPGEELWARMEEIRAGLRAPW